MKEELEKWAAGKLRRLAPRTVTNLESITRWDAEYEENGARILLYERDLRDLRREVDAIRREQRRVVELYDAVFAHVRANGGVIPSATEAPEDRITTSGEDEPIDAQRVER